MKSKIKQLVTETIDTKPYNQCITCAHFGKTCGGANFLSMNIHRMGEWARIRKEYLGWTNEYIATETGVSLTTVANFLAGHMEDIKLTTAQAILGFLSNDFAGSMPCYDMNSPETETSVSPLTFQKMQQLERENARLERELIETKEDSRRKLIYLKDAIVQKDALIEKKDALIEKLTNKLLGE